jgi:PTS system cellobiose-specific IIB component
MYAGVQFTMMKGVFFMKKIVLLCASGMSTSILVNKMKEAAAAAGKDYEIAAYSASEAATKAADADVVLLGPQIRFSKDKIAAELPGVPVEAIDMRMYGRMDGKGTVELAEKIMKG